MSHLFSRKHLVSAGDYIIYKKDLATINKYDTLCVRQLNFADNTHQLTAFSYIYIAKINDYVDKVGSKLDNGTVNCYNLS